ncbi:GNAT family N-acetyltransferase [Pararhizobium sp.]|uniref:GNAT family N-acetyltransferase n=1 Tax=Pararhizobium sp. TaxID=1977563 RepID=UPI002726C234|nr:GNAT family N-acetyltransferase [Pararhizobium sp.]MDO9418734.1 GNAT family N-acetyltransferase [Pararhizobium sp.]
MGLPEGYSDVPDGKLAAIVTCLEMFARPAVRDEAAQPDLELRHVKDPDLSWYRDLYLRVGGPWLWASSLTLADHKLAAVIQDPGVEVWAAFKDGKAEGLMQLDFRTPGLCELLYFGLTDAVIGKGAGRWLMNRAIDRAWSQPIGRFWVHTCSIDHPAALAFYIRSGFTPFKRQVEIFDDPRLLGALPLSAGPHIPVIPPKG